MKDDKKILDQLIKTNKKKALAIAVATAFMVGGPIGLASCYNPQNDEDEQNGGYSGGYGSGRWNGFSGGSSINEGSSSNGKSGVISSSGGKSSGYSGSKGGSSSS